MKLQIPLMILAVAVSTLGSGQSAETYLKLRKELKIVRPVDPAFLDTMVGIRTLEIRCTIKGTIDFEGRSSVYIENTDGSEMVVDAKAIPDWIKGNPILARLLVKATRTEEFGPLKLEFVSVANDADVVPYDQKITTSKKEPVKTSSSGSGAFSGPIGPRGSVNTGKTGRSSSVNSSRGKASSRTPSKMNMNVLGAYTSFIQNHNKRLKQSQAQEIAEAIIGWSLHYDVDARLVVALVIAESDFIPSTMSHKKAMGLGQLIPEIQQEFGVTDPWDTNQNIYATVGLLKRNMNRYGVTTDNLENLHLALAAYNAGPGAVKKYGYKIPPYKETQNYVRKIKALYDRLRGIN
jgi:hypothetical protein